MAQITVYKRKRIRTKKNGKSKGMRVRKTKKK